MCKVRPEVRITYCAQCNWLLRSAWIAQELLSTFGDDLGAVTLVPATGGRFEIALCGEVIWERVRDGGFPDIRALKRLVRDRIDPGRDLGHVDRPQGSAQASGRRAPGLADAEGEDGRRHQHDPGDDVE